MSEVVATIEDLGLPADMSSATMRWQQRVGAFELKDASQSDYEVQAEALLAALAATAQREEET